MGFSIQDYLKNNKIEMGSIKKEVGDTPYKGGHNDIRKTNYEVKIKEDGKLDLYTHKTIVTENKNLIKEASEIKFNELDSTKQKLINTFEKFFGGKHQTIWDGIHGNIVEIKVPIGRNRLDTSDLRDLSTMKLRWIEFDGQIVSVGF
jgi:heterodisulfide reductase subunit C